jgi:hypothetical protein
MNVHLELDWCPLCSTEVCVPMRPRFEHWQHAHPDVADLTVAQVSWILNRTEPELDLNNKQITACKKHAGAARYAYNWGLRRKQEVYKATGRSIRASGVARRAILD